MTEAVHVPPRHPEAGIDLLAAVAARVAEREEAVRPYLRTAAAHDAVADGEVAVFHHDVSRARSPQGVPGTQVLAAEGAFDTRAAERAGHQANEVPASPE